jgi:cobalamin biosynthesis Co2+ chelatase CbiK
MTKAKIACLNVNCPEQFSVCCGARGRCKLAAVDRDNADGFICSSCGKDFVGGECNAGKERKKRIIGSENRHFYQKSYDEGRLDVLNHLMQIADECEYEELRREVQAYADIHDIQIGEPVTYKN